MGHAVHHVLERVHVTDPATRGRVVNAVKQMMKNEPVAYGGIIGVAVALGAAFGLDLTAEQLGITLTTVITIVTCVQRALVSPVTKKENER